MNTRGKKYVNKIFDYYKSKGCEFQQWGMKDNAVLELAYKSQNEPLTRYLFGWFSDIFAGEKASKSPMDMIVWFLWPLI